MAYWAKISVERTFLPYDVIMNYLRVATDETIRNWLGDVGYSEQEVPVERVWLNALRGRENRVSGTKKQIEGLIDGLRQWTAPLRETRDSFRTCLRLEAPGEGSEKWYPSFYLQATDNPSLLVAARDIWQMDARWFPFRIDILNNLRRSC